MKTINVDSHNVPATARSKNYQTALATTASSGGGATTPSVVTPTGGAADTAKVAQNLAEDSTDWAKIMRKDQDERTENSLSIGKNITVDGKAILNDVQANTGTFAGLLKAASATITGGLVAATVNATTVNATTFIGELQGNAATSTKLKTPRNILGIPFDGSTDCNGNASITGTLGVGGALTSAIIHSTTIDATTFIGELQGNAATATKLKTVRTIWGQSFDGSGNVSGSLSLDDSSVYWKEPRYGDQFAIVPSFKGINDSNILCFQSAVGDAGTTPSLSTKMVIAGQSGNVGIGTTTPNYKLDVNGTFHASGAATLDFGLSVPSGVKINLKGPSDAAHFISHFDDDTDGFGVSTGFSVKSYSNLSTSLFSVSANGRANISSAYILGDAQLSARVMSPDYVSQTKGWGITRAGAADFRNIYADELRVQAFTADISQALAGSDYLTKSVSKLSSNFVIPAVGSSVRIIVDDLEGMPATRCFSNGDYIRFRAINRTAGLTVSNAWGTVVLDTSFGTNGFSNGTQAYTFTCTATSGAGLTVFKGSEVLDYGTSGSGLIARTTLDAMGSPYEQIATWNSDPSNGNNYTVHARLGNLNGIANCSGYGLYSNKAFLTDSVTVGDLTKSNYYLDFSNGKLKVQGDIYLSSGKAAVSTLDMSNGISLAVDNIQIGGRNLLVNSKGPFKPSNEQIDNYQYYPLSTAYLEKGKTYTLSGKTNGVFSYIHDVNNQSDNCCIWMTGGGYYYIISDLTTGTMGTTFTWQGPTGTYVLRVNVYHPNSVNSIYAYDIKIDEGNKKTTWTPAPEDVDANIATAQSTAITTAASNAAALYVTQTAYSAQVTILQNSINSKVSQTDFNALGQRVTTAETNISANSNSISAQATNISNLTGRISNAEAKITPDSINLTVKSQVDTSYNNAVSAAATDATARINSLQIGGRNLARNSKGDFTYNLTDINNYTATMCKAYWVGNKNTNIVVSGDVEYSNIVFTGTGSPYTRIQGTQDIGVWNAGIYFELYDKISEGNGKFHFSFATSQSSILNNNYWFFSFRSDYITGTVTFRNLKVEYGTKETSWTPAPEDVDASINLKVSKDGVIGAINLTSEAATINASKINLIGAVTFNSFTTDVQNTINGKADSASHGNFTYINGNSVYTGTLTANQVNAVGINANSIATGTLSADRIAANSITANKLATNVLQVGNITGLGSLATQNSLAYNSSYLTNKPTSLSAINTTEGTKLGGIAAGATVGATWGTNIGGIPTNLSSLNGTEGIKNTLITISSNGTLSGAGGGQVTVSGIGACTPSQAQGYATTSQNSAQDNLATQLGYTNYSDLVTKAASSSFGTLVVGGYLNTALIQAQAILTNMLAAGSVTADKIAGNTITGDKIVANSITSTQINAKSVAASIATVISLDASRITTGTLSADRIDAVSVVTKGLVAQKVQAATLQTIHNSGEAYVDIHNGIIDIYGTVARNIQFGVNDQGMAVLKYFNNDGINLYDLGPNGIDAKNLQSAQWEEIQYVRVLSIMQTVPPNGLVSDKNASVLFRLNTKWNLTTIYRYHAGKINGTIVSDSANGFTTAAAAAAADGKFFTVRRAGNLANDTYTENNGSYESIGSDVRKKYWVIQNGVSTSYYWTCSLEIFNMINGNY